MHIQPTPETCCGCLECVVVCPKNAIKVKTDEKGFVYPFVENDQCAECSICEQRCDFKNRTVYDTETKKVYASRIIDKNERKKSRSGGIFTVIAKKILMQDGVVYGCALDKNFNAKHIRISSIDDLEKIRKVKYIQSNILEIYQQIEEDLKQNKKVLFCGMPCQAVSINNYLNYKRIDRSNLILLDMVCHGVPGNKIWNDYIGEIQRKKGVIIEADFRDKSFGWHAHKESFYLENGKKYSADIYARMFWKDLIIRPSCFNCIYQNNNRVADITIGDYWNVEKEHSNLNDETGTSLCVVRSDKGIKIFNGIKSELEFEESFTDSWMQLNLKVATKKPEEYDKFWKDYSRKGFIYIKKKYGMQSITEKFKSKLRKRC